MSELTDSLQFELERAVERLHAHPRAGRVLDGTACAAVLARYYMTAHLTVREAPVLLRRAHASLLRSGAAPELIALFARKVAEETGHDRWLENDLAAIGHPLQRISAPAAELYNTFHHRVTALSGEAFLGTAWVLESLSLRCAGVAAQNLRSKANITGIAQGLSFLSSHYEADSDHVAQLTAAIERCVTQPAARDYVRLCARFTATVYPDFFGDA